MIIRLRTLTRKSIIGFGNFKDLTVGNLLDTRQHKALVRMYYNLSNITFVPEILDEIMINPDIRIDKPGKSSQMYSDNIYKIICKINESFKLDPLKAYGVNRSAKIRLEQKQYSRDRKITSRGFNRKMIQNKL